jgi:hypothetical protein
VQAIAFAVPPTDYVLLFDPGLGHVPHKGVGPTALIHEACSGQFDLKSADYVCWVLQVQFE